MTHGLATIPIYEDLRKQSRRPRLHPNGFIQLDLVDDLSVRLHVWPDEPLQAQLTRHPIHDHSFDMKSEILAGCLTNLIYTFQPSEYNYQTMLYRAKRLPDSQDTILAPAQMQLNTGYLVLKQAQMYAPAEEYKLIKSVLHDSIPHGLTVTIMQKLNVSGYSPLIAVPKGIEPDNNFRRETIDEEILWSFIQRGLEKANQERVFKHIKY